MVTKRKDRLAEILENIEKREQENAEKGPDVNILLERLAEDIRDNMWDII